MGNSQFHLTNFLKLLKPVESILYDSLRVFSP